MPIINFSATFNLDYYRDAHPELNLCDDEELTAHYEKFADAQGLSSCPYDRREFLKKILQTAIDKRHLKTLEIGCDAHPFLVGENVKYFELVDSETLRTRCQKYGLSVDNLPEKIHFVDAAGDLNVVDEKFDVIFTSHVIEHVPDLIAHFQDVSKILNAGGLYVLIIPDKRFCFDRYNAESTLADVIDAFVNGRKTARLADVIGSVFTRTHNNPVRHWLGDHGERFGLRNAPPDSEGVTEIAGEYFFDDGKNLPDKVFRLIEKYAETLEHGEYVSAHNWRFTPDSFGYIVNMLNALNFVDLPLYRLCRTIWGRFEFIAMLERR